MTGRYASRSRRAAEMAVHRSRDKNPPLAHLTLNGNAWVVQGTRTVAHAFQEAGWRTGMTGKWHLSSTVETETTGFTYQEAQTSAGHMAKEVAEVGAAGFDDVFALYPINMKDSGFSWFSHNPEFMAVEAMDWWDRHKPGPVGTKGRFLYFAFTLPHMPKSGTEISKVSAGRFPDPHGRQPSAEAQKRMNAMRERSRRHVSDGRAVGTHNAMGNKNWAASNDKVHNVPGVLWIDSIIGEWRDFLARNNELDDTLIVFSADHGNIAKGHCFEPSMRVPLLMHWPRGIAGGGKGGGGGGRVVDAVTSNIDIAPTLLDAAGIDSAWLRHNGKRIVDGRSLLPLVAPAHARFAPGTEPHPAGIFCEIYSDRSVVAPNYTLVDLSRTHYDEAPYNRKPWGDTLQLYRSGDFEQRVNLVAKASRHEDPVAAKALAELTARLHGHVVDTIPKCQVRFWPEGFPTKLTNALKGHRGLLGVERVEGVEAAAVEAAGEEGHSSFVQRERRQFLAADRAVLP